MFKKEKEENKYLTTSMWFSLFICKHILNSCWATWFISAFLHIEKKTLQNIFNIYKFSILFTMLIYLTWTYYSVTCATFSLSHKEIVSFPGNLYMSFHFPGPRLAQFKSNFIHLYVCRSVCLSVCPPPLAGSNKMPITQISVAKLATECVFSLLSLVT